MDKTRMVSLTHHLSHPSSHFPYLSLQEPTTTLPSVSHSELLATISSLQTDLTRISQSLGETSSPVDPTDGTPMRQHEEAKALIRQLEAYKSGAIAADGGEESKGTEERTQPAVGDGRTVTYELHYTPDAAKITTLAKAAEMEERITKVEKLVGSNASQKFGELVSVGKEEACVDMEGDREAQGKMDNG